ncbi:3-keto-disaccharide hydrolase [Niveispirillum fermenti]|uniref:3-keto-disaccharide hydrolase n=1 Tax=Niveispirillum fermenti TaxID=1233113 RepID=UPI003A88E2C1
MPVRAAPPPPPWRRLIPDRPAADGGLPGWKTLGGHAPFTLEGGEIVGRSVAASKNSFLTTRETFGDFILEFDVKTDPRLNTGVMIRSESRPDYRDGVVHGYQVEIDPSDRRWTGGIYDEERRLWLASPAHRPETQATFRPGGWNHLRVEAIGPRIRTWLNGKPAANLVDDLTARGFFGLQVHDVGPDPANEGMEVRFRDIRVITDDPARFASPVDARDEQDHIANHLTAERHALGWRLLWNGTDKAGWVGWSPGGWWIDDGTIRRDATSAPLIATQGLAAFELEMDVAAEEEGAAGGILYLDGATYRLAQGPAGQGMTASGSMDGRIAARNLTDPNPDKPAMKPVGHWNRVRICVTGDRIEHWLNGSLLVAEDRAALNLPESGPIVLLPGQGAMRFRSIRILPLEGGSR